MIKTTRTFDREHMRPYWSTADMPVAPPLYPFADTLKLRYDASSEIAYSDSDAASTLTDFSGQSNDATAVSSYDAAIYKTSIMNGLPVFRFNGSTSFMSSATNSFTNAYTQHMTIAVAYIPRADASGQRFFGNGANSGGYTAYIARASYSNYNTPEAGATKAAVGQDVAEAMSGVSSGTPLIAIGVWNGSNIKYYQNGTLQATTNFTSTSTSATSNTQVWGIGAQLLNGGADLMSQVDIGEVSVWDTDYSGTDLDTIASFFTDKWIV